MKLFEQALAALQSGIMILDDQYRVHFINDWLNKAFVTPDTLQGQAFFSCYPELKNSRVHRAIEQALEAGLPSLLSPGLNRSPLPLYRTQSGSEERFEQSIRIQPMTSDGKRYCMVEVQDVSAMVRREKLLNKQAEELNRMALTDELTGIANRRHFNLMLEKELRLAISRNTPLSLVLFDIDYFKQYNDHFGHQDGDKCLAKIAGHLAQKLAPKGLQVTRYGGEEFCIILPGEEAASACQLAEYCRSEIEALALDHPKNSSVPYVTASFGVASKSDGLPETQAGLTLKADSALYRAKLSGRNRVVMAERPVQGS